MATRLRPGLVTVLTVSSLALAGCSSAETSRDAARTSALPAWPMCSDGLAPECVISIPSKETIIVNNGSTIIFTEKNEPVKELSANKICWSDEEVDGPLTCVGKETQLPGYVDIRRITVESQGKSWPALSINVLRTTDTAGELFMPLPGALDLSVRSASGETAINIEIACCDEPARVTTQ